MDIRFKQKAIKFVCLIIFSLFSFGVFAVFTPPKTNLSQIQITVWVLMQNNGERRLIKTTLTPADLKDYSWRGTIQGIDIFEKTGGN